MGYFGSSGAGYFGGSGGGYFGGSASGGGLSGPSGGKVKSSGSPGGILGFAENLGSDFKDAIGGLPAGVKHFVEHPVGTLEDIGRSYAQTYGPLFHGDFGAFADNLEQHPLGPILDAITVLTLGAGASAKVPALLAEHGVGTESAVLARLAKAAEPGVTELRGPSAVAGEKGALTFKKATSRNPAIRARQQAVHGALNKLPYDTKVLGELARFAREMKRGPEARSQAFRQQASSWFDAFGKLSKNERRALAVLGRLPLKRSAEAWKQMLEKQGTEDAKATLELLNNEKVAELYNKPSANMLKAHKEALKLDKIMADKLAEQNVFTADELNAARFRHMRVALGGKVYSPKDVKAARARIEAELTKIGNQQEKLTAKAGAYTNKRVATTTTFAPPRTFPVTKTEDGYYGDSKTLYKILPRDDEHLYHATNAANFDQVRKEGLRPGKERKGEVTGVYFAEDGTDVFGLVPRGQRDADIYLRVKKSDVPVEATDMYEPGSGFTEWVSREPVSANRLEYLGEDNQWHPLMGRKTVAPKVPQKVTDQIARINDELQKLGDAPPPHIRPDSWQKMHDDLTAVRDKLVRDATTPQTATTAAAKLRELSQRADELRAQLKDIQPGIVGGPSINELRDELAASGRPEPLYLPDINRNPAAAAAPTKYTRTGYGTPTKASDLLLFKTGQLALDPDVLTPQFLKVAEFARHRDLHDLLIESAVRVRGAEPPPGHVWVNSPADLDKIPNVDELKAPPDLTTSSRDAALVDHGSRYAVPVKLARQVAQEQRQASNTLTRLVGKSTDVWRALVLNTRVGWLTGNIVGNQFLYALQFAGPDGARAYANMVLRAKGPQALLRMLKVRDPHGRLPGISKELLDEYFPEQTGGTFIGSQTPNPGRARARLEGTRAGRGIEAAGMKLAKIDKASETGLRAAAIEAALRSSPELRRIYKQMPKDTRDFNAAAKQALDENPLLARQVSDRANAALGDFLGLSQFERRVVRGVFPFYAWYRAITKVAVKLPLDQPGRATILSHLGEIANEEEPGFPVPSYLAGSISLGGDRILKTQSLNPLMTVPQVAGSVASFLSGGSGQELGREINPFAQVLGNILFGDKTLPASAANFGTQLPLVHLAKSAAFGPNPSKVYEPSTIDDLLAYLGAPTKTVNRYEAAKQASAGR